jgi:hypothetical protein
VSLLLLFQGKHIEGGTGPVSVNNPVPLTLKERAYNFRLEDRRQDLALADRQDEFTVERLENQNL